MSFCEEQCDLIGNWDDIVVDDASIIGSAGTNPSGYIGLVAASKEILEAEFKANRIDRETYAKSLIRLMESSMVSAISALEVRSKLEIEIEKSRVADAKSGQEINLLHRQILNLAEENLHEIEKKALTVQQKANLIEEELHEVVKKALTAQQTTNLEIERLHELEKTELTEQQTLNLETEQTHELRKIILTDQQTDNLETERLHELRKTLLTDQQSSNLETERLHEIEKTDLTEQQTLNLETERLHELQKTILTEKLQNKTDKEIIDIVSKIKLSVAQRNLVAEQRIEAHHKAHSASKEAKWAEQKFGSEAHIYNTKAKYAIEGEKATIRKDHFAGTVHKRQIEGFTEDYNIRKMDIVLKQWAVIYSADPLGELLPNANADGHTIASVVGNFLSGIQKDTVENPTDSTVQSVRDLVDLQGDSIPEPTFNTSSEADIYTPYDTGVDQISRVSGIDINADTGAIRSEIILVEEDKPEVANTEVEVTTGTE